MPWPWFKKIFQSGESHASNQNLDAKNFFVITAIFNPASFQSRYDLYREFARHMEKTGAQLITVECIFPSLNQHEFQVTDPSNPFHIQLKSDSIYWMKENLINIAVSRLPPHAKWICWLDADISFHKRNWVEMTIKSLKKYVIVQVFEKANFSGPPPQKKVLQTHYSFGYSVVHKKIIDQQRYNEWYPHPGYGWAMAVDDFKNIDGLPDFDIVGSGDLHFAFSLVNKVSNAVEANLNPQFKSFILDLSERTFKQVAAISKSGSKSTVGYVPVTISHSWHGSRKDRQYVDRWKILIAHDFNFSVDVRRTDIGLLELNPNKPLLQKDILEYFRLRHEDTNKATEKDYVVQEQKKRRQVKRRNSSVRDDNSGFTDNVVWPFPAPYPDPGTDPTPCPCPDPGPCPCPDTDPCPCPGNNDDTWDYANDYNGSVQCTSQY